MDGGDRQPGAEPLGDAAEELPDTAAMQPDPQVEPDYDETLADEIGTLIDDGRNYAQAELNFQKTRAKLAGRTIGFAAGAVIVALILLHIALLALAVGLVMALEPLVTIWGAIAIVVGGLLVGVLILARIALKRSRTLSDLFSAPEDV